MMKQLYCVERDGQARNRPQQDEEVGRGQRKKYRRIQSDSESSEEFQSVEKQVSAKKIQAIRARSFLEQYKADKESSKDAATSKTATSGNESELNEQILGELKEIKSVLVETLTLLKNGCTPLLTAPVTSSLVTPPEPASDLLAQESSPVLPAPRACLQPLHVKDTRSIGDCKKVRIGPNTSITAEQFGHVKWTDAKKATKDLLISVFGRRILATHCYTGKCSNAFKNKDAKPQLDPEKVSDIISYIKSKFNTEVSVIKKAISEKCSDECKLSKRRNCV
ncbi:uncharacterized protein LOC130414707 [Triplophysa dalaica]|uniref:uncharacterized protein LOC130414707 n=1 Tax=Triplophysa dalaica TaxID=1582913 RepID=UPI0024E03B01|nr:uncharacterized protein LOC130414707 [Triplophysa dalaica]